MSRLSGDLHGARHTALHTHLLQGNTYTRTIIVLYWSSQNLNMVLAMDGRAGVVIRNEQLLIMIIKIRSMKMNTNDD